MQRKIYEKAAELGCPSRITRRTPARGRRAAVADTNGYGLRQSYSAGLVIVMSEWGHILPSRSPPAEVC